MYVCVNIDLLEYKQTKFEIYQAIPGGTLAIGRSSRRTELNAGNVRNGDVGGVVKRYSSNSFSKQSTISWRKRKQRCETLKDNKKKTPIPKNKTNRTITAFDIEE